MDKLERNSIARSFSFGLETDSFVRVGQQDDSVEEVIEEQGWDVIESYTYGEEVRTVVRTADGTRMCIGDVNGPCMVEIEA